MPKKSARRANPQNLQRRRRARKLDVKARGLKGVPSDERIRRLWDRSLSAKENYERLGLRATANDAVRAADDEAEGGEPMLTAESPGAVTSVVDPVQLLGIGLEEKPRVRHMGSDEKESLRLLVEKYGTDYAAMARDIRLNILQHSVGVLRRKCRRYVEETQ